MKPAPTIEVVESIAQVAAADWNRLAGDQPLLSHAFLNALHETGCASAATGWAPCYLLLREAGALAGAMPLYLKSHSYGEYVFDWAWANAYRQNGLSYYPKLVSAIPFTPVSGRRLLAATLEQRSLLIHAALDLARDTHASSFHCLFPTAEQMAELSAANLLPRDGVQFHWQNTGYADFDGYLATMSHDHRKKIRQERRRVREAGIAFEWIEGAAIDEALWRIFYRCYAETYRQHGSTPYLNLDFFRALGKTMPQHLLLMVAFHEGRPVAASFNIHDGQRLWGRYWGALEYYSGLHFETCYYQVIQFCIARGIVLFEGGAQGEHKIARGLLPTTTHSAHWLAHPQFALAVETFLERETAGIAGYVDELNERSPFKKNLIK